jgi:hypothetical protein
MTESQECVVVLIPLDVVKREVECCEDFVFEDMLAIHQACIDTWKLVCGE